VSASPGFPGLGQLSSLVTARWHDGHVDGRARLLTERISRLRSGDRIALAVMWAALLFLGLPGLVLTFLNDPENLPIALTVVIGGTIVVPTVSVLKLFPKGFRASRGPRISRRTVSGGQNTH
jgi:hypothetical protein